MFNRLKTFTARGFASFRIAMLQMAHTSAVDAYQLAETPEEAERHLNVMRDIQAKIERIARCAP